MARRGAGGDVGTMSVQVSKFVIESWARPRRYRREVVRANPLANRLENWQARLWDYVLKVLC